MDQLKYFTCSLQKGDKGKESGSGVIVKIDGLDELLKENSCLSVKIGRESNLQTPCYALITAHSIIYAPDVPDEHIPDEQVADRVKQQQLKIIFGKSIEIPLEGCIQCRAVSCCGRDSILRLTEDLPKFTLMPHKHTHECHIKLDFIILFLNKEFANKLPKTRQPPSLDIMQCWDFPNVTQKAANLHCLMYWRCEGGKVKNATVENVKIPPKLEDGVRSQLRDEIKTFTAHQVLQYDRADTQSHIGAPIVLQTANGKGHMIGIKTEAGISTFYGITKLLKGGVVPFLSVMQHSNARILLPSRYEPYIVPHIESLHVADMGQYLVDLLHYLTVKDSKEVAILKLNPSDYPVETIAAFNILTAIFMKFKGIDGHAPAFKHHDGSNCECFIELCSTTRNHLELFKDDRVNPFITKKVEAMFRCLEAMLNYEDMAREFLNGGDSVDSLIELAKSEHYASKATIQRWVLNIVQKGRHYQKEALKKSKQVCAELQKEKKDLHARLERTCEELEQTQKNNKDLEQMHDDLQKEHKELQKKHEDLERDMQKRSEQDLKELQERRRRSRTMPLNFNDSVSLSSGQSETIPPFKPIPETTNS